MSTNFFALICDLADDTKRWYILLLLLLSLTYIVMVLFQLFMTLMLGFIAGGYDTMEILVAVIVTGILTLSLTLFAFNTK